MVHRKDIHTDADYAHAYLAELQDLAIAAQIKVLREQREWTQDELATRARMAQTRISLLESAEYSSYTLATLRKLARAFDVGLRVIFAPFHKTAGELERASRECLQVVARVDEQPGASTQLTTLNLDDAEEPTHALRIDVIRSENVPPTVVPDPVRVTFN